MTNLPKLILSDIDGVWTDGGMYLSNSGAELKKFNTSDSAGVLFCKLLKIPVGIITGEKLSVVKTRARKLRLNYCLTGIKDKVSAAHSILQELQISWDELAYIGDDLNDMALLEKAGYAATVANAPVYITQLVDYVSPKKGGEGAFRDFVEHLLMRSGMMDTVLDLYRKDMNSGFSQ